MIAQSRLISVCKRRDFLKLSFNAKQLHKSSFLLFCTFLSNYGQISWYHNMKTTQIWHLRNTVISILHLLDYDCGKVLTTSQQVSDEALDIVFSISAFSKIFSEKSFFR